jgi:hypothetical protein
MSRKKSLEPHLRGIVDLVSATLDEYKIDHDTLRKLKKEQKTTKNP